MPINTKRGVAVTPTRVALSVALGDVENYPGGLVRIEVTGAQSLLLLNATDALTDGFEVATTKSVDLPLRSLAGVYLAAKTGEATTVQIFRLSS